MVTHRCEQFWSRQAEWLAGACAYGLRRTSPQMIFLHEVIFALRALAFVIFYCFAVLILKLSFNIYLGTLQLVHFIYLISFRFVADRNLEVKSYSMVYMHLTRGVSFIKKFIKKRAIYEMRRL